MAALPDAPVIPTISPVSLCSRHAVRNALHGPDLRPDAHGLEIAGQGLAHGVVGRERVELAGVEAVRIAGLGQELLGLPGLIGRRLEGQGELEAPGDDAARQLREAERLGLVDGGPVDGVEGRPAHAQIMPGRLLGSLAILGDDDTWRQKEEAQIVEHLLLYVADLVDRKPAQNKSPGIRAGVQKVFRRHGVLRVRIEGVDPLRDPVLSSSRLMEPKVIELRDAGPEGIDVSHDWNRRAKS